MTFQNQRVDFIAWSRDGRRIAFSRLLGSAGWEARVKNADGSGADSLAFHAPGLFALAQCWSPDGQWLVVDASDSAGNMDLWRVPVGAQGSPGVYQQTPDQERFASVSLDGHWIAYVVSDNTGNSLYVQSFPTPGTKYQIPTKGSNTCAWSAHGDVLYAFNQNGAPTAVPISLSGGLQVGAPRMLFEPEGGSFVRDLAADGRFLRVRPINLAGSSSLEVVMNWASLIAK